MNILGWGGNEFRKKRVEKCSFLNVYQSVLCISNEPMVRKYLVISIIKGTNAETNKEQATAFFTPR